MPSPHLAHLLKPDHSLADGASMFTRTFKKRIWSSVAVLVLARASVACPADDPSNPADSDSTYTTVMAAVKFTGQSLPSLPEIAVRVDAGPTLAGYTIRRTVPEVRIQFTVADDRGRLMRSLTGSDFRVLDNRSAVSHIGNFSRLDDLPLQIGILVDVSDSVHKTAEREKKAAEYFLQHVLRPQTDRASLLAFSSEIKLWQRSTGERDALFQALANMRQLGYATYLYDSVYRACREQFPAREYGDIAQRILVLITDGDDNGSLHSLADAVAAAQRKEIQIFALSVHSPRFVSDGDGILRRMADDTGGQFYVAGSEKDFPAIFAAMELQMRTQYAVSFQPGEQTPGFHSVKIETAGQQGLRVHARQGYFYDAP